jgi:hypothetical protein
MAEPTARIDPASSYREPDADTASRRNRDKPRAKAKPPEDLAEVAGADELDDQEKHTLDTLA